MKYARIQNNTVLEILEIVQGFTAEQCFHPIIIAMCEMVDDSVQAGWVREEGVFVAPAVPVTPVVPVIAETTETAETTPVVEETPPVTE